MKSVQWHRSGTSEPGIFFHRMMTEAVICG
nr:MAG TPA: hypothetical protein [Caudoviricetes sp.]